MKIFSIAQQPLIIKMLAKQLSLVHISDVEFLKWRWGSNVVNGFFNGCRWKP